MVVPLPPSRTWDVIRLTVAEIRAKAAAARRVESVLRGLKLLIVLLVIGTMIAREYYFVSTHVPRSAAWSVNH